MASFVELVGVSGPFTNSFDHRPVIIKVDFIKVSRGSGYWKFNNATSLTGALKDLNYGREGH